MNTSIYFFSATGNSLTTAKLLADGITNCKLIPVASTRNKEIIIEESDRIGFVYPVYYGDMPYPVRELVAKMRIKKNTYIFSVATYRGHHGHVAERLNQLLEAQGVTLSLSLGLPMPGNSYINDAKVDQEYLDKQKEHVAQLLPRILANETVNYEITEDLKETPVQTPNNFRGITAEDSCIGCGTCVTVCPMENIVLEDGKALIGEKCATCLACFHWCPVEAIYMSKQENISRRSKYHHPDVQLEDIVEQKQDS